MICPRALLAVPALALVAFASPAAAGKLDARAILVASTPADDAVLDAVPQVIELAFAEPAQIISVTLRLPDDTEVSAEPEEGDTRSKAKQVRYRLPAAFSQPGEYSLSYLLVSRSFKSLNGFVHFRIAGETAPAVPEAAEEAVLQEPET